MVSCTRALMSVARYIYNYGNCFMGKYFLVYFSTTKTTKILTPEKYPLYGKKLKSQFFTLRAAHLNCSIIAMLYTHSTGNQQ